MAFLPYDAIFMITAATSPKDVRDTSFETGNIFRLLAKLYNAEKGWFFWVIIPNPTRPQVAYHEISYRYIG